MLFGVNLNLRKKFQEDINQNSNSFIQWNTFENATNKMAALYRQVSNIRRTLVGNRIVDNADVVGESPVD